MSVVNEFTARTVRLSQESRTVFLTAIDGRTYTFTHNIDCVARASFQKVYIFFSIKSMNCLILMREFGGAGYRCGVMKFWIENNMPVPSAKWMLDQDRLIESVSEDFADKYASYLIDEAINA